MLRSQSPALIAAEHAAWVTSVELARATARAAAAVAVPARKGRRAGQPVHPRQISFTAARRAILATTRSGWSTKRSHTRETPGSSHHLQSLQRIHTHRILTSVPSDDTKEWQAAVLRPEHSFTT